jgi:hypothetical protein
VAGISGNCPIPLDIDTPFRRTARSYKSPNTAEFDRAVRRGAVVAGGLTDLDLNLYAMAIWLAQQSKTLRDYYQANPFQNLVLSCQRCWQWRC